jgi:hypothetical protein
MTAVRARRVMLARRAQPCVSDAGGGAAAAPVGRVYRDDGDFTKQLLILEQQQK